MQPELVPGKLTDPDRRQHPRYRFSVPLTIRSAEGAAIPGISIEISAGGISAICAGSLKVDEIVELGPVATGSVSARVRRKIGRVYGFEFLNLNPDQSHRIGEMCKTLPRHKGMIVTGLL
jgi:hypothetical protein